MNQRAEKWACYEALVHLYFEGVNAYVTLGTSTTMLTASQFVTVKIDSLARSRTRAEGERVVHES